MPAIDVPALDTFGSTANRKIKVWSEPGFLACVDVIGKINLPTEAVWRLLTHDDNDKVFRALKRTSNKKIRKQNLFYKEYDVDHITGWQVLWFSGEFCTRLRVKEWPRAGKVHFDLLSSDIMDNFDGAWVIKPFTQSALDGMYGKHNLLNQAQGFFARSSHQQSLIEFNQKVQPKSVPKPLQGLARRIASNSMKTTLEDIDAEAVRIRAGNPTLPGFEQFADKQATAKTSPAAPEKGALKAIASCTAEVLQRSLVHASTDDTLHTSDTGASASALWESVSWRPWTALQLMSLSSI